MEIKTLQKENQPFSSRNISEVCGGHLLEPGDGRLVRPLHQVAQGEHGALGHTLDLVTESPVEPLEPPDVPPPLLHHILHLGRGEHLRLQRLVEVLCQEAEEGCDEGLAVDGPGVVLVGDSDGCEGALLDE